MVMTYVAHALNQYLGLSQSNDNFTFSDFIRGRRFSSTVEAGAARKIAKIVTHLWNYSLNTATNIIAPPTPTRYGTNTASTIDLTLVNNFHFHHTIRSISELSSDHNPIIINFTLNIQKNPHTKIANTNWNHYKNFLNEHFTYTAIPISDTNQIDTEINNLTTLITTAYNNSSKRSYHNNCHFLPPHLKQLITQRNQARKAWQLFRDPPSKRLYNQIQARLRKHFKIHNDNTWENKLASLTTEDNSLWLTTSSFKKNAPKSLLLLILIFLLIKLSPTNTKQIP
ncbi:RNA-directed DNA polymerase from mobile element jockey [Caerostris extrusa]|uniref:RNA-directed DNA polymerase from mobile element jockey n=1 Tax=Caerostris extrusa TaxID=172846 RepID=A0AAV4MI66_CAEEX|nr:RNA-directed DNA polymerase from mobile element jockey [Caerostris extrusa]